MSVIKINDMKDQLEELVTRVQAGETILIEKDGQTVARLEGLEPQPKTVGIEKKTFDWDALRRFTDSQPMQAESAGDFIHRMRDEDRY